MIQLSGQEFFEYFLENGFVSYNILPFNVRKSR